jgi:hypothetical protein
MATQPPPGSTFPAADPGFAALPVEELLASVEELVARIRLCFGVDRETFDLDVLPLLRNYAAYVPFTAAPATTGRAWLGVKNFGQILRRHPHPRNWIVLPSQCLLRSTKSRNGSSDCCTEQRSYRTEDRPRRPVVIDCR